MCAEAQSEKRLVKLSRPTPQCPQLPPGSPLLWGPGTRDAGLAEEAASAALRGRPGDSEKGRDERRKQAVQGISPETWLNPLFLLGLAALQQDPVTKHQKGHGVQPQGLAPFYGRLIPTQRENVAFLLSTGFSRIPSWDGPGSFRLPHYWHLRPDDPLPWGCPVRCMFAPCLASTHHSPLLPGWDTQVCGLPLASGEWPPSFLPAWGSSVALAAKCMGCWGLFGK